LARIGPQQPRKLVRDWLELARIGPHESNFAGDYLCIELLTPKKCTNNKQKLAGVKLEKTSGTAENLVTSHPADDRT
jgi:hypothetical protein